MTEGEKQIVDHLSSARSVGGLDFDEYVRLMTDSIDMLIDNFERENPGKSLPTIEDFNKIQSVTDELVKQGYFSTKPKKENEK